MTPSQEVMEPNAAPQDLTPQEEQELADYLRDLRRISAETTRLERIRKQEIYPRAIPLLKRAGSRPIMDPVTGDPYIANVRAPQTLEVDYDKLEALVGEEVARSVCKPPQVDTKDDGLFHQAIAQGVIPMSIVAEVSTYKAIAEHVGFSKPDARP